MCSSRYLDLVLGIYARERIEGVCWHCCGVLVDTLGSMDLQSRGMAQSVRR